ncbi:MAG: ATP-binding cassette domain-containing protein [bacterium]|jgi:tungstate transport system ATP-binding protein|nr:ATP-binding cassette domain-containing protein [bacterium]
MKTPDLIYQLENLTFSYEEGSFTLSVDELAIKHDGITGIAGPSGSGKTTLLLNLAFLLVGQWKEFQFEGRPVDRKRLILLRNRVTYVPQNPILFSGTVESNLLYPLSLRGIKKTEALGLVNEVAEIVGINSLLTNRSHQVSGGEAQRVCLARALVFEPDVILLDEPTANLDEENVKKIEEVLKAVSARAKLIMVSHDMEQVRRLCSNLNILRHGKLCTGKE